MTDEKPEPREDDLVKVHAAPMAKRVAELEAAAYARGVAAGWHEHADAVEKIAPGAAVHPIDDDNLDKMWRDLAALRTRYPRAASPELPNQTDAEHGETRYYRCPRCDRVWQSPFMGANYSPGDCCAECLHGDEAPGETCVLQPVVVIPLGVADGWHAALDAGTRALRSVTDRLRAMSPEEYERATIPMQLSPYPYAAHPGEPDIPPIPEPPPAECVWESDSDGCWDSSCGGSFQFNYEGPTENGVKFCPYCGKPLKVLPYVDDYDDEPGDEKEE